jgi:hypothetical protein
MSLQIQRDHLPGKLYKSRNLKLFTDFKLSFSGYYMEILHFSSTSSDGNTPNSLNCSRKLSTDTILYYFFLKFSLYHRTKIKSKQMEIIFSRIYLTEVLEKGKVLHA